MSTLTKIGQQDPREILQAVDGLLDLRSVPVDKEAQVIARHLILIRFISIINPGNIELDVSAVYAAGMLQNKLSEIVATRDQTALQNLERLSQEVTQAHPTVKAFLPRGTANELLAAIERRTIPLTATLCISKLPTIAPTHNQAELDALNLLRQEVVGAAANIQALLPGNSTEQIS